MKFSSVSLFLQSILFILIVIENAISKSIDEKKNAPKKVTQHGKSTKNPKSSIIEQFKGLSQEDADFVKQLDKQFQTLGGNLKIEVINENTTVANKNSKRTIDGNLG